MACAAVPSGKPAGLCVPGRCCLLSLLRRGQSISQRQGSWCGEFLFILSSEEFQRLQPLHMCPLLCAPSKGCGTPGSLPQPRGFILSAAEPVCGAPTSRLPLEAHQPGSGAGDPAWGRPDALLGSSEAPLHTPALLHASQGPVGASGAGLHLCWSHSLSLSCQRV